MQQDHTTHLLLLPHQDLLVNPALPPDLWSWPCTVALFLSAHGVEAVPCICKMKAHDWIDCTILVLSDGALSHVHYAQCSFYSLAEVSCQVPSLLKTQIVPKQFQTTEEEAQTHGHQRSYKIPRCYRILGKAGCRAQCPCLRPGQWIRGKFFLLN